MSSIWHSVWKQYRRHPLGMGALVVLLLFVVVGIYAPLLASSKPLVVQYEGVWYFPLFRYLFYPEFFTKKLDIFYNLLMFTFPLFATALCLMQKRPQAAFHLFLIAVVLQCSIFLALVFFPPKNPAASLPLPHIEMSQHGHWEDELQTLSPYGKLNLVLRYQQALLQRQRLAVYERKYLGVAEETRRTSPLFPSLWNLTFGQEASSQLSDYFKERSVWLEKQLPLLTLEVMPFLRPFHWEDDAGGDQLLNRLVSWWDLTRINRKDMVSALLFGIRISLSVGLLAIGLALLIGIPIGAIAGYFGGKWDLIAYRLIEIWESMPTFFMLLMVVAFLQSKSIFLIIATIALFGWTSFSRFIRGEFFRQKALPYVEACHALGYTDRRIIFSHILPNAIPPLLTLIPFAMMGAITSEAGLSFLGLGEEGSNSWGVLMDEGRSAFPAESDLLWPPAILLTLLLVSIALIGDTLRDALDPKRR